MGNEAAACCTQQKQVKSELRTELNLFDFRYEDLKVKENPLAQIKGASEKRRFMQDGDDFLNGANDYDPYDYSDRDESDGVDRFSNEGFKATTEAVDTRKEVMARKTGNDVFMQSSKLGAEMDRKAGMRPFVGDETLELSPIDYYNEAQTPADLKPRFFDPSQKSASAQNRGRGGKKFTFNNVNGVGSGGNSTLNDKIGKGVGSNMSGQWERQSPEKRGKTGSRKPNSDKEENFGAFEARNKNFNKKWKNGQNGEEGFEEILMEEPEYGREPLHLSQEDLNNSRDYYFKKDQKVTQNNRKGKNRSSLKNGKYSNKSNQNNNKVTFNLDNDEDYDNNNHYDDYYGYNNYENNNEYGSNNNTLLSSHAPGTLLTKPIPAMNPLASLVESTLDTFEPQLPVPVDSDHQHYIFLTRDLPKFGPLKYNGTSATYTGQYKNGLRNGLGTLVTKDGEYYHGLWFDDRKSGYGRMITIDGDSYEGELINGVADGYGVRKSYLKQRRYEGYFRAGMKHGRGKEVYSDGSYFRGEYLNGKKQGNGEYKWANGTIYRGMFEKGKITGTGKGLL